MSVSHGPAMERTITPPHYSKCEHAHTRAVRTLKINRGIIKPYNNTMKESNITFGRFCDSFSDTYKNNFTYAGKRALYEYFEELDESTGEETELDTVSICCEFSEYSSALDCVEDCGYDFTRDEDETEEENEAQALAWLEAHTLVIRFDSGIIIQQF